MTVVRPPDAAQSHVCRHLLIVTPSAVTPLVSVTTLRAQLGDAALAVSYVADRHVLTRESFGSYAKALATQPRPSLEAFAKSIAEDIANEVVPKWLRVSLSETAGEVAQTVVVEDRQPGYEHPSLPRGL